MTKVISILNLKGGVAKTTLTVALADTFAIQGKRVLVVDLDPQCDTSIMLVGHTNWKEKLRDKRKTLASLFIPSKKPFVLVDSIVSQVSDITFGGKVVDKISLLASDVKLADIQDGINKAVAEPSMDVLAGQLQSLQNFDLVLIDCPPNFGIFTRNALVASTYYIIPAIPDYLSLTLGAARTKNNVARFKFRRPKLAGIVLTKYQSIDPTQRDNATKPNDLNDGLWGDILHAHVLKQSSAFTKSAYYHPMKRTYVQKYPDGLADTLKALALELWDRFK